MQFQTISKRLSPEGGECRQNVDTLFSSSHGSKRWQHQQNSRDRNHKKILSPAGLAETPTGRSRRKTKKESSKHYQVK